VAILNNVAQKLLPLIYIGNFIGNKVADVNQWQPRTSAFFEPPCSGSQQQLFGINCLPTLELLTPCSRLYVDLK